MEVARHWAATILTTALLATQLWACSGRPPVGSSIQALGSQAGQAQLPPGGEGVLVLDPDVRPISRAGGIEVSLGGSSSGGSRRTQTFSSTTTRFKLTVTAPDMAQAVTAIIDKPQDSATASVQLTVPAGAGRTLKVEALNAASRTVANASVSSLVVTAGSYTPVTVGLTPAVGDVAGTVTDQETKLPIPNVTVKSDSVTVMTDSSGRFKLPDINVGAYTVEFFRTGYSDSQQDVVVSPGATANAAPQVLSLKHWTLQISGTPKSLFGVLARSATEALAWGQGGTLIRTIDGGQTWSPINTGQTSDILQLQFATSNTGYFITYGSGLYKTSDGGSTWSSINSNAIGQGLTLIDSQNIWIWRVYDYDNNGNNDSSVVSRSVNGGSNFATLFDFKWGDSLNYSRVSDSIIWGGLPNGSKVVKSTSGGSTFSTVTATPIRMSTFPDSAHFFLATDVNTARTFGSKQLADGDHPAIVRTIDGGVSWETEFVWPTGKGRSYLPLYEFTAIVPIGAGLCAVGTFGAIAIQYPGNPNWVISGIQPSDSDSFFLRSASFFGGSTGWAVGDGGVILKY